MPELHQNNISKKNEKQRFYTILAQLAALLLPPINKHYQYLILIKYAEYQAHTTLAHTKPNSV